MNELVMIILLTVIGEVFGLYLGMKRHRRTLTFIESATYSYFGGLLFLSPYLITVLIRII